MKTRLKKASFFSQSNLFHARKQSSSSNAMPALRALKSSDSYDLEHTCYDKNHNYSATPFLATRGGGAKHHDHHDTSHNSDESIRSSEDDRVTVINFDEIRRDFNSKSVLNSPAEARFHFLNTRRSTLVDSASDKPLHTTSYHVEQLQGHVSKESGETSNNNNNNNKLNKSSVSMSELDNIKKETILDLKSYQTKFQSLNDRLRKKFAKKLKDAKPDESKTSGSSKKLLKFERLIRKTGEANINRVNIPSLHRKYISDLFNTIIDMKWRYLLLMFILSFFISWLVFAAEWILVENMYQGTDCVANLKNDSFFDALLFSIETQQTIGYGSRFINTNCHLSILILMVQCGFSVVLESFMGGIVFAKLSRPKKRTETLIFSNKAVIAKRDNTYSFMCRVGDMRKSHIISAYVSMYLIKTRYTAEGEVIPWNAQKLQVGDDHFSSDRLIFMPTIVEHIINHKSPLYDLIYDKSKPACGNGNDSFPTLDKFKANDFEIVVILEGTVESTGATTQARTSYLPSEILWNHVFEPLIDDESIHNSKYHNNKNNTKATIDFSKFDLHRPIESRNPIEADETEPSNYSLEEIFPIQIKSASDSKAKRHKTITFCETNNDEDEYHDSSDKIGDDDDDYANYADGSYLQAMPPDRPQHHAVQIVNESFRRSGGLLGFRSKIHDLSRSLKSSHC